MIGTVMTISVHPLPGTLLRVPLTFPALINGLSLIFVILVTSYVTAMIE